MEASKIGKDVVTDAAAETLATTSQMQEKLKITKFSNLGNNLRIQNKTNTYETT